MIRVALIGLGLIGGARLKAIEVLRARGRDVAVDLCFDPQNPKLKEILQPGGYSSTDSIDAIIASKPDLVIVATPHDIAVETTNRLLDAGLKLLLEKPMGRSLAETKAIAAHTKSPDQLWIGHNFRFFAGIAAMYDDLAAGRFGRPIGMSILMGHGGSPRDKDTWKLDPVRAGGGALIDPGIHLIDLSRIAGGDLKVVGGASWKGFWNTGIEEEVRAVMTGSQVPVIDFTVSVVRWRSMFRIEIFGSEGYGVVQGRGRSYGTQTYRRGVRWGWQSGRTQEASEEAIVATEGDEVFADELDALLFGKAYGAGARPCSSSEALENMEILEALRSTLGLNLK